MWPILSTIGLLILSNVFMTLAWYGHLNGRFTSLPLWIVVLGSWGIALVEYCFQVPANRIGYTLAKFNGPQLKTTQEIITLLVFAAFSVLYLKEPLRWNHGVGFALMIAAAFFIFNRW